MTTPYDVDLGAPTTTYTPALQELQVRHLRLTLEARGPIGMHRFMGSSLRGALFDAMMELACQQRHIADCVKCPLQQGCPVAELFAPHHTRGGQGARIFTVRQEQPLAKELYPGDEFSLTLGLFGQAIYHLPLLIAALQYTGSVGIGRWRDHRGDGTFALRAIHAVSPTNHRVDLVWDEWNEEMSVPSEAITLSQTHVTAAPMSDQPRVELRFITPLRLSPHQRPFLRRAPDPVDLITAIVGRHNRLAAVVGADPLPKETELSWYRAAQDVHLVDDDTTWVALESFSGRQGRWLDIGGIMGRATYDGPGLPMLLPALLWGSVLQIGESSTKGNGLYRTRPV